MWQVGGNNEFLDQECFTREWVRPRRFTFRVCWLPCKLVRADATDIKDIHFLRKHYQADLALVKAVVSEYPAATREVAEENLVYIEILQ